MRAVAVAGFVIPALLLSAPFCGSRGVARAADTARTAKPASPEPASAADDFEIDTENIFGFTQGSDVNDRGEQEVELGVVGVFSRASAEPGASRYRAWEAELEYEYGVMRNLTLSVGAAFGYHDVENIVDLDDLSGGGFNGLSAELKYRFLSWNTIRSGLPFRSSRSGAASRTIPASGPTVSRSASS